MKGLLTVPMLRSILYIPVVILSTQSYIISQVYHLKGVPRAIFMHFSDSYFKQLSISLLELICLCELRVVS